MRRLPTRFLLMFLVPVLLVTGGTLGYYVLEPDMTLFRALYLTVLTLTTVGYGDIVPHTDAGRTFTMFLVLGGVFTVFFAASEAIKALASGELAEIFGRQRMEHELQRMHDHIIVCGYGRMGRLVCREFQRDLVPFVIINDNAEQLKELEHGPRSVALAGDATSDEVLQHAGILRARGLVAVMGNDAANLFTTMSARLLNPKIHIVARVEDMRSEPKLLRAGANRVVSPYQIGGARVAQAILKPTVMDFIELATRTEHIELQMEETRISEHSTLAGLPLNRTDIRGSLKCIVVAVKKSTGKMIFNPDPETILDSDDVLVAMGHRDELNKLDVLANPPAMPPK